MTVSGNLGIAGSLMFIAFVIAAIGGWVANIVKLFYTLNDPITGMFIARCFGVFAAPLGAILGYM